MKILELIQNSKSGKLSSNRLGFLSWTLVPLLVWTILCFFKMEMISPPQSIVYLIGIAFTGKIAGTYVDNKTGVVPAAPVVAPTPVVTVVPTT